MFQSTCSVSLNPQNCRLISWTSFHLRRLLVKFIANDQHTAYQIRWSVIFSVSGYASMSIVKFGLSRLIFCCYTIHSFLFIKTHFIRTRSSYLGWNKNYLRTISGWEFWLRILKMEGQKVKKYVFKSTQCYYMYVQCTCIPQCMLVTLNTCTCTHVPAVQLYTH